MRIPFPKSKPAIAVIIIVGILVLCSICCVSAILIAPSLPTTLKLTSSPTTSWDSKEPTQTVKFDCTNAQKITLNGSQLNEKDKNELCIGNGYKLDLQNGQNTFTFVASHERGDVVTVELKISFDKKAYEDRLAAEEKQRQEEEAKRKQKEADDKAKAEAEANKPKVGDSLLGPSYEDIKAEYEKQNKLSSYKGMQYLESLKGTKIVWVAEIGDVDEESFGDDLYISLLLSTGIVQNKLAFVDNPKPEYLNLNMKTVVKVTGTIKEVNTNFLGQTVYINGDATFEVIN
ncbi:MAG: cell envelope integrity protein TolA [Candidatus Dojkabacteria bacterium]|nr:MAG: cell envelope integrity protein TolA [Candidatus Dojkabacteria bacterium]